MKINSRKSTANKADSEDESRGINLIASDDEDDVEEIEPEDEQDNKRNNSIDPC